MKNNSNFYKPKKIFSLIFESIQEPMIILLLSIAAVAILFSKFILAFTMIFVVFAYIAVESINKFRTNRTMVKLKNLTTPTAKIIRNGKECEIKIENIIPDDIIVLSSGTIVPADAKLLNSFSLVVDESTLTGESLPVKKEINSKIFSGTTVLSGQGTALVTKIGEETEFGKISKEVQQTKKEKTLLQEAMLKLAKVLAFFAIVASLLIPVMGFLRGLDFQEMVLTWLSLTFLMIPGQPPIIITMALALGAFELAKKNVIVKRLRGIETIGQVTLVVSDKTGTITENIMQVEKFFLEDGSEQTELPDNIKNKIILAIPDYCSDPTDKAISKKLGTIKILKQIDFKDFSDNKAYRDLVYQDQNKIIHAISAAPEIIISNSTLSSDQKKLLEDYVNKQALLGKRVVAYGYFEDQDQLQFLAIAVLTDPVRPGVKNAIKTLENAKIKTLIVTGDFAQTAKAVAKEINISGEVITGDQIENMSDTELIEKIKNTGVFARIKPTQKLRLVNLLQKRGEIVAVIGDGINDAPALKIAQVGVAMGQIGTDLAKEISDLILTDDNYKHIANAVKISRKAIDNFKKGLSYYLSAKTILLVIFLVPLLLGIPFPFVPIQIIFIELLMDLASSTIFVTEQAEPDIMQKKAPKISNFLGKPLIFTILKNSIFLSIGILFVYLLTYKLYNLETAQTSALVSWLLGHILLALNLKQERMPLVIQGVSANKFAIFWFLFMIIFSLLITFFKPIMPYFQTTYLPISIWGLILTVILVSTFWLEIKKIAIYQK
ncbi:cation-transporting P-type ATPase [Candidatus Babeliales bacterium]|nr:cation-transporting P-type ATPase [Candidatus Babeliales bacterium]MCF7899451.1 cation-transporting P-type ATPase [Candidatus Babeliales bacterium]